MKHFATQLTPQPLISISSPGKDIISFSAIKHGVQVQSSPDFAECSELRLSVAHG